MERGGGGGGTGGRGGRRGVGGGGGTHLSASDMLVMQVGMEQRGVFLSNYPSQRASRRATHIML